MRQVRIPSIDSTHFTLIASELESIPVGWGAVESPRIVTLTRTDDPVSEPL
jgi:hypothetical protein